MATNYGRLFPRKELNAISKAYHYEKTIIITGRTRICIMESSNHVSKRISISKIAYAQNY